MWLSRTHTKDLVIDITTHDRAEEWISRKLKFKVNTSLDAGVRTTLLRLGHDVFHCSCFFRAQKGSQVELDEGLPDRKKTIGYQAYQSKYKYLTLKLLDQQIWHQKFIFLDRIQLNLVCWHTEPLAVLDPLEPT
jgi:hypothetical protein